MVQEAHQTRIKFTSPFSSILQLAQLTVAHLYFRIILMSKSERFSLSYAQLDAIRL